jgi:hypothetical protein
MVASDEVEEAFLDEGFTDAATDWGLTARFGDDFAYDFFGHRLRGVDERRLGWRRLGHLDPPATRAFDFVDNATYGAMTYGKTQLALYTVQRWIGDDRFFAAMRRYVEGWKFRHPRRADFIAAFRDAGESDAAAFLEDAFTSVAMRDVGVRAIEEQHFGEPAGFFDADGGVREVEAGKPHSWRTSVVVDRRGPPSLGPPVDVRVVFDDGSEVWERWTARDERWHRYNYEGKKRVVRAEVDPDRKQPLDTDRWNNSLYTHADSTARHVAVRRLERWLLDVIALVMR